MVSVTCNIHTKKLSNFMYSNLVRTEYIEKEQSCFIMECDRKHFEQFVILKNTIYHKLGMNKLYLKVA